MFADRKSYAGTYAAKLAIATLFLVALGSCSLERKVCPAYQSAFIFDTSALRKKFSYFINDTPKIYEVSKDKFLIIEPLTYREQLASWRTIEMLPIYPVIPDSLQFTGDAEMASEMEQSDSTAVVATTDSISNIHPGLIGPFNVEQENYMYYFRKLLVLPDVRASMEGDKPKPPSNRKEYKKMMKERKKELRKKSKEDRKMANTDSLGTNATSVEDLEDPPAKRNRLKGKRKGDDTDAPSDVDLPPDNNAPTETTEPPVKNEGFGPPEEEKKQEEQQNEEEGSPP